MLLILSMVLINIGVDTNDVVLKDEIHTHDAILKSVKSDKDATTVKVIVAWYNGNNVSSGPYNRAKKLTFEVNQTVANKLQFGKIYRIEYRIKTELYEGKTTELLDITNGESGEHINTGDIYNLYNHLKINHAFGTIIALACAIIAILMALAMIVG